MRHFKLNLQFYKRLEENEGERGTNKRIRVRVRMQDEEKKRTKQKSSECLSKCTVEKRERRRVVSIYYVFVSFFFPSSLVL